MTLTRHQKQELLHHVSALCPFCNTQFNLTDSSHVVVADKTPQKYKRKAIVEEFEALEELEDLDETIEQ
ncbi:MAG: hypothetical protein AB7T17_01910 [Geobacter sp.]